MLSDYNKKKKEFEERTKQNRDNWTASNSIGDTQGANAAHKAQEQNVAEWDKYTGGKSTYDEESGEWKYSDKPDRAANYHMNNRELKRGEESYRKRDFSYNVEDDPLYQQYLSTAHRGGQAAMTDTIAKSAAQTGGIAGSYAVAAGAGAYNDYMQSVNDIIPELERLAYDKYRDELARDLNIYEMDEAKKWEEAEVDTIVYDYQHNNRELSESDIKKLRKAGMYVDENGDIVDGAGNHYERGTKEKKKQDDYDEYFLYGWDELDPETRRMLDTDYDYDEMTGMLYDDKGFYKNNDSTQAEILLANYKMGMGLTPEELEVITSQKGYGYNEQTGKITYLGRDVDRVREVENPKANGSAESETVYVVKKGDTLGEIAKAYGTTVQALAANNGIQNPDKISIGQKITIPTAAKEANSNKGILSEGTPYGKAMKAYLSGEKLTEKDVKLLTGKEYGFEYKDGRLYYKGAPVARINSGEEVGELMAARSAAVISGHTGEAIPEEYADILEKYGFRFDEKRNEWIHKDSGMTLMEYTG